MTGEARALVRGGAVVVLPAPVETDLVDQVWDQLGAAPGVVEVLQVLTGAFGSSLRTIPPFAVAVVADRRVHVAVRGALAVTLEVEGGDRVHVDGDDVTTWSERVVDDVVELLVRTGVARADAPAGEPLLGDRATWPLASAVVLADAVAWQLAERPARAVEPAEEDEPSAPDASVPSASVRAVPDVGTEGTAHDAPRTGSSPTASQPQAASEPLGALGATVAVPEETMAPEPDSLGLLDLPGPAPEPEDDAPVTPEDPFPAADDYSHLWGSTVLRTVEDAAVRAQDDADDEGEPPAASPSPSEQAGATVPPPPGDEAPPVPGPHETPHADGLIAGVPREWTGATPAAAHRAATVTPDDAASPDGPGDGGLDHDGHTVLSSAIADLRAAAQGTDAPPPPPATPSFATPPAPGQQQILARTCAQGHANPPSRDTCAACGGALDGDAALAVRPPLGRLLVSTGQTVELDRGVVVGRRPRTPRTQAADLPRLVTVPSPQQDISRSHLEVTLEGWHVLVSDMATTNGTTLLRAGQPPRRLHPSEPVLVVDGDVVDLGDGVTLTFEGIW
ncbi:FHA domain-containing protein [Cellulosimicrobium sp. PMB13]|uniref:FHA domain-containing protein n=1 Tax=Cellulosimicrobium sp. PMB13 TaxID=3120158 RepID=UPI003F4C1BFF